MWPLKIDMTKDECRGALRHLGKQKDINFQRKSFLAKKSEASQNNIFKMLISLRIFRTGSLFKCNKYIPSTRKPGYFQT